MVSSIGTPLEMDLATKGKTRPNMAKVRVEIDLLKHMPDTVYVGQSHESSPQTGFVQKLEYKGIPKYYKFCKKLGHMMPNCRVLETKKASEAREEEPKKGKDISGAEKDLVCEHGNKQGVVDGEASMRAE